MPAKRDNPAYNCWAMMIQRCTNPRNDRYDSYGGAGIVVCDRWRSFDSFIVDMGPRPSPVHSLDRFPDRSGNYEPGNVRWATPKEQQNNMIGNTRLTLGDKTLTLSEWAERLGIKKHCLNKRLIMGWSAERTLTTPVSVAHQRLAP